MKDITLVFILAILIITLAMLVGDEAPDPYFDMVCEGSWPDYREIEPECGEVAP